MKEIFCKTAKIQPKNIPHPDKVKIEHGSQKYQYGTKKYKEVSEEENRNQSNSRMFKTTDFLTINKESTEN